MGRRLVNLAIMAAFGGKAENRCSRWGESEIAGHAGRRLDAMICCRATDYERLDISGTQLLFRVGADESAVHSFDDDGLAFDLARFTNSRFHIIVITIYDRT